MEESKKKKFASADQWVWQSTGNRECEAAAPAGEVVNACCISYSWFTSSEMALAA